MSEASIRRFLEIAAALPEHLQAGAELARGATGLPEAKDIDTIVVLGMGTGHTAGCVLKAVGANLIKAPILIESSYTLPACVGARSLVFAISGSGDTDEVNHTAAAASERGARPVVVTTGGWLADFGKSHGVLLAIPPEIKPARATFGVVIGALLAALDRIDLLPGTRSLLESADEQLLRRRDQLAGKGNIATQLAALLAGRHVVCQGDDPLGAVAAERWKAQINQNAKQPASVSVQPNASHNEAVAWDCPAAREGDAAVLLRHPYEDPRVGRRMDLFAGYLQGKIPVLQVLGEGSTPFAALMDLMMIGDFASLRLAARNNADPSDVTFIAETVKQGLTPPAVT